MRPRVTDDAHGHPQAATGAHRSEGPRRADDGAAPPRRMGLAPATIPREEAQPWVSSVRRDMSMSGRRPATRSATARLEPQDMVHPRWPWPALTDRFRIGVGPR